MSSEGERGASSAWVHVAGHGGRENPTSGHTMGRYEDILPFTYLGLTHDFSESAVLQFYGRFRPPKSDLQKHGLRVVRPQRLATNYYAGYVRGYPCHEKSHAGVFARVMANHLTTLTDTSLFGEIRRLGIRMFVISRFCPFLSLKFIVSN